MKYFTFCITLFFIYNFIVAEVNIELLNNELSVLIANMPENSNSYITGMNSEGAFKIEKFALDQIENKMNEYGFSELVKEKFRGVIFAQTITFRGFSFVISTSVGSLEEIVGYAQNNNNEIDLVFLHTRTTGNLIAQFDVISNKSCKRVLGIKIKCKTTNTNVPRGYHTWEINIIETSLRSAAYQYVQKKIQEAQSVTFLSDISFLGESTSTPNSIFTIAKKNKSTFQNSINGILNTFSDNIYISQLKDNINSVIDSVTVTNFVVKMEQEKEVKFAKIFCTSLQMSSIEECENLLTSIMKKNFAEVTKEQPKSVFRICLLKNNQLKFSELLINYSEAPSSEIKFVIEMKYLKQEIQSTIPKNLFKTEKDDEYHEFNTYDKIKDEQKVLLNLLEVIFQLKEEIQLLDKLSTN